MPSYLTRINQLILEHAARLPDAIHMGENIDKGSCICGIAKGLGEAAARAPGARVVNVGNCENTHVGLGFGVMLNGGNTILYVKQLDFLALAADPLINTLNLVRGVGGGGFTIVAIVCDQGFQGPQSSWNGLSALCSLTRAAGYAISDAAQAEAVFLGQFGRPGFRIVALSQRLFGEPAGTEAPVEVAPGPAVVRFGQGSGATIACFGFTLPQGFALRDRLAAQGGTAAMFAVHDVPAGGWNPAVHHAAQSGRLYLLDDGKGAVSPAHKLAHMVLAAAPGCRVSAFTREEDAPAQVCADRFEPNFSLVA